MTALYTHRLTLDPLAAAVYSLDRFFSLWHYDATRRLDWLQKRVEKYAFRKEFRQVRKNYCELLAPWDVHSSPEPLEQRALLHALHAPLDNEPPSLATQVQQLSLKGQLWVLEEDLLASLAHMHKIRLFNLDMRKDQQLYTFWHHALDSIRLRPAQKEQSNRLKEKG